MKTILSAGRLKQLLQITMCAQLILCASACEEDDPTPNTELNNNNDKNNSKPDVKDCDSACAALATCDEVDTMCQGLDFAATCKARCEADDSVVGYATLSCAATAALLDDAAGLQGTCAQINMCQPKATDYSPGQDDQWESCVSDGGTYEPIQMSISSIGRVEGYEQIAALLWEKASPSTADFVQAREIYAAGEGLDSRVQRREDEHYPAPAGGAKCSEEGIPATAPDRCVGPAKILPILTEAFNKGIDGESPEVNAAKVDAALLWFLYVSSHKEATTCTNVAKDCDSAYAYYTGGIARSGGIGLAGQVLKRSPKAHDRVWDGILAVRCWRDLDDADTATNLDLRDRAISQLDEALLYGLSRVIAARVATMQLHEGAQLEADWAWLKILGPVLDRDATARDSAVAQTLRTQFGKATVAEFDAEATLGALDALYPCP